MIELYKGDCLIEMQKIPDQSVDMILCDLPYGTTACKWDSIIQLDTLWAQYRRIVKETTPIVLFSQQPFTSRLISSNFEMYKYNWIWEKDNATNFLISGHQPLKYTEDICVFGFGATTESRRGVYLTYNPQLTEGKPYSCVSGAQRNDTSIARGNGDKISGFVTKNEGTRQPRNIIKFNRDKERLHPTQKPVALLEYLVKTYTNPGQLVLDNTMGSGSTGVACVNTGRDFIGIELDEGYFRIAERRIADAQRDKSEQLFNNGD